MDGQDQSDGSKAADMAWQLMVELRKEVIEAQKQRAIIDSLKITFLSATIGVLAPITLAMFQGQTTGQTTANVVIPIEIFTIPSFTSLFFDSLVRGYNLRIYRIALYCREVLEKRILGRTYFTDLPFWEEFLEKCFYNNDRDLHLDNVPLSFWLLLLHKDCLAGMLFLRKSHNKKRKNFFSLLRDSPARLGNIAITLIVGLTTIIILGVYFLGIFKTSSILSENAPSKYILPSILLLGVLLWSLVDIVNFIGEEYIVSNRDPVRDKIKQAIKDFHRDLS